MRDVLGDDDGGWAADLLAITALAEASVALDRPELLDAATGCARSLVDAGRRRQAAAATPLLTKVPRSAGHWLAVAEADVRGPLLIGRLRPE